MFHANCVPKDVHDQIVAALRDEINWLRRQVDPSAPTAGASTPDGSGDVAATPTPSLPLSARKDWQQTFTKVWENWDRGEQAWWNSWMQEKTEAGETAEKCIKWYLDNRYPNKPTSFIDAGF